jgi:hypothetical protein
MAEHAAATSAAAAHVVPAAEEITATAMPAERAAAGVAFLMMSVAMPVETETEVMIVMALMHGMEEVVQTHEKILYR